MFTFSHQSHLYVSPHLVSHQLYFYVWPSIPHLHSVTNPTFYVWPSIPHLHSVTNFVFVSHSFLFNPPSHFTSNSVPYLHSHYIQASCIFIVPLILYWQLAPSWCHIYIQPFFLFWHQFSKYICNPLKTTIRFVLPSALFILSLVPHLNSNTCHTYTQYCENFNIHCNI